MVTGPERIIRVAVGRTGHHRTSFVAVVSRCGRTGRFLHESTIGGRQPMLRMDDEHVDGRHVCTGQQRRRAVGGQSRRDARRE